MWGYYPHVESSQCDSNTRHMDNSRFSYYSPPLCQLSYGKIILIVLFIFKFLSIYIIYLIISNINFFSII